VHLTPTGLWPMDLNDDDDDRLNTMSCKYGVINK